MYGPVIIEDPDDGTDYDDELVVVLDDWIDGTGTTPDQVLELRREKGIYMGADSTHPEVVQRNRPPSAR